MVGYPTPEDDTDADEIGQRFLEDLRTELADTLDDYGRTEWRKARDRQVLRLRSYGWSRHDLTAHYGITEQTVTNILRRSGIRHSKWTITLTGTPTDLTAIREFLDDRAIPHTVQGVDQ